MTNNAIARLNVAHAKLPATYEHAKTALAKCHKIDECKTWADKAQALASYARQADDPSLYNHAVRIQARAVRRAGELLKTFQTSPKGGVPKRNGKGADTVLSQREAAKKAKMSKRQEVTAVRVANVPQKVFDAAIENEQPATVTDLAAIGKTAKPAPPGFKEATRVIGTLSQAAKFCEAHPAEFIAGGIYGYEVERIRKDVAVIKAWLSVFAAHLNEEAPRW
jgi:hypothetical protein